MTTSELVGDSSGLVKLHSTAELVSTGEAVAGEQVPQNLELPDYDRGSCVGQVSGFRTFLSVGQERICSLAGERIRVHIDLTDLETLGETTASVEVTARLDPMDVAFCE